MKLNVFFFGLICHISENEDSRFADHAAIVNAPEEHVPLLVWRDGGTTRSRLLEGSGEIRFSIDGEDPAPAPLRRHGLFQQTVVKLAEILPEKGSIHDAVQHRGHHTGVAAYVVFPLAADQLRLGDFYRGGGSIKKHGGGGPNGCIPRLTMMTIDASASVSVIGAGDPLVFAQDACILFSNVEQNRREDRDRPCHTEHYTNISTAPIQVTCEQNGLDCVMSFVPDECSWVPEYADSLRVEASEFVECANTQWP